MLHDGVETSGECSATPHCRRPKADGRVAVVGLCQKCAGALIP